MKSAEKIDGFIDRELSRNIQSKRIIIAGFSQGGAVAYQVALSKKVQLGGLLAMSTYFATVDSIKLSEENKAIPIKIQHGIHDPVVPESLGQKATTQLVKLGYSVNYQNYPMEHAVCPQQIADISHWLREILS